MKKDQDKNQPTTTNQQTASGQDKPLIAPNSSVVITIPSDVAKKAYTKTINKLAKNVKVAGFRAGKVPAKIAAEQLNPEYVIEKALQLVLPELYESAIKESGKTPISYPEFKAISVEEDKDWQVEAQFAETPQLDIKNYKKTVSKAHKDAEKEWKEQESKAKSEEPKAEKPESETEQSKEQKKKEFIVQKIYSDLAAEIKPQIPEILVKQEAQYEVDQLVKQLQMFNMKLEDFLARRQVSFESFSNEVTATALGRLQLMFILGEISRAEKLEVSEADIDKAIAENPDSEYVEKQKNNPEYRSYLKETISRQKVVDHLLSL